MLFNYTLFFVDKNCDDPEAVRRRKYFDPGRLLEHIGDLLYLFQLGERTEKTGIWLLKRKPLSKHEKCHSITRSWFRLRYWCLQHFLARRLVWVSRSRTNVNDHFYLLSLSIASRRLVNCPDNFYFLYESARCAWSIEVFVISRATMILRLFYLKNKQPFAVCSQQKFFN